MRRLIVGCGYLGQRVASKWLQDGGEVHVLTRSAEHATEFRDRGFIPTLGDVLDPASLELLPEVDTVFWAVGWDRTSGRSMSEVYVSGLEHVIRRMKSRCRRFIAISSTSVYGQNHGEWVDEESPCEPRAENGQTCLKAERVLLEHQDSLDVNILRLSGIYGPNRLLSRVAGLKSAEPLAGNPDTWLNLIHVDDAADAVIQCETADEVPHTLLVSDNEPMRRREYYSTLAQLVGAPVPQFTMDLTHPSELSVDLNKRCRNRLAQFALNWSPRFETFREGLPHAVQSGG